MPGILSSARWRRLCLSIHHQTRIQSTLPTRDRMGQPSSWTHPHLIRDGDVTPGISRAEFRDRRKRFADAIPDGSVAIVAGYALRYATGSIFYPFHQNTDLLYLTGFNEPDAALVIEKDVDRFPDGFKDTLYVRPKDPSMEIWDGPRSGLEGATSYFGVSSAEPVNTLLSKISNILEHPLKHSTSQIITDLPSAPPSFRPDLNHSDHAASAPQIPAWTPYATLLSYLNSPNKARPLNLIKVRKITDSIGSVISLHRLVKSPAEIAVLRESGRISGRAHVDTMAATKPGVSESYLHSVMEHAVRRRGSDGLAYVPVVASGSNALILHYVVNRGVVKDGDLVLMDAGGEYGNYASDITRTWPANGQFSPAQKRLYTIVLKVQKACIEKCTEASHMTLDALQDFCFGMLKVECSKLFGRRISYSEMSSLYPHHVGHWMGLDVHDTHSIPRSTKLKEGMVITIEPGLYIPNSESYPSEYRGIGIRIEDDIVIGKDIPLVLTAEAPKEIEDIEAVCKGIVGTRD